MGSENFKKLTTLKVGGKIKYFFAVANKEELIEKVDFAKRHKLPIFIIGMGSDIAPSDNDFNGVVIKYMASGFKIDGNRITAEAGLTWDDLVRQAVNNNLCGVEKMSGIPGTCGAAPIQNIGAYGQELSDTCESLEAYSIASGKFVTFKKSACKFDYRDSIFKKKSHWQKYIITSVTFKFTKNNKINLKKTRNEILKLRKQKLEDYNEVPNAGSFFKNPIVDLKKKQVIEKEFSDISIYPLKGKYKISAGWLIEKAGWKGRSLGKVKVSDKHALIITNPKGRGNFSDIKKLADTITSDVYRKFKIKLEPEVQYINV